MATKQITTKQIKGLLIPNTTYLIKGTPISNFPVNPKYGDLVFLTDDGTDNSQLQKVYEYNGFNWEEIASNYNLSFIVKEGYDISSYIYPIPTKYIYNSETKELKAVIIPIGGLPQEVTINQVSSLVDFNESEYRAHISLVDIKDYIYDTFFKTGDTDIDINNYENTYMLDVTDLPDLKFTNNKLNRLSFSNAYIKDIIIDGLVLISPDPLYLSTYTQGDINIKNVSYDSNKNIVYTQSFNRSSDNPMHISFDNIPINNINMSITTNSGNNIDLYIDVKNIDLQSSQSFSLTGNINLKQLSFDSTLKFDDITSVNLGDITFDSQEQIDSIIQSMLDNGLGVNNIGKEYIDLTAEALAQLKTGKGFQSNGRPMDDANQDSILTYKIPAIYRTYKVEGITPPTVGSINTYLIRMFALENPTSSNAPSNYQSSFPNNGSFFFTPNSNSYTYMGMTLVNRSSTLTYDWTETFKLYDTSPVTNISVHFYGTNFTPSQSIVDKLKERSINLFID